MKVASLVAALAGCGSVFGLEPPELVDAGLAPPVCVGSGDYEVCVPAALVQNAMSIDTSRSFNTATDCTHVSTKAWCVLAARTLTIHARFVAQGPNPLVLLGVDDVSITTNGIVDVASHRGELAGASANHTSCLLPTDGTSTSNGGGGGAGGSFGSRGGDGGAGASGVASGAISAELMSIQAGLRGGCPGTLGGNTGGDALPTDSGGAVYLVAGSRLAIEGTINASGAGGGPGVASKSGGSGGGSGGMIVLSAPTIDFTGMILANGGGGGGGTDAVATGGDGADPIDALSPAAGGSGGGAGTCGAGPGCGGAGAYSAFAGMPGLTDTTQAGGGGGGGGGGVIRVVSGQMLSGRISPTPGN